MLIVLVTIISALTGKCEAAPGVIYNKVICAGSSAPKTVQCSANEIMDIHSITTLAAMDNLGTCDDYNLPFRIAVVPLKCKRLLKSDGEAIVQRCHGYQSCSLDGSVVPLERPAHQGETCERVTNVIWFQYYCVYVDSRAPYVSIWPVPQPREIRGLEIQMFSPNYPDYTPTGSYIFNCTLTAIRQNPSIRTVATFQIIPRLVQMKPNRQYCQDNLYFMRGPDPVNHKVPKEYCGTAQGLNIWNDEVITAETSLDLQLIYKGGEGTKYWLTVLATEQVGGSNIRVEVVVSCSKLDIEPPSSEIPEQTTAYTTTADNSLDNVPSPVEPVKEKQSGTESNENTGLVVGMSVLAVAVVIIAVIAAVLGWKLRKKSTADTDNTKPETSPNHDPYETIPAHIPAQLPNFYSTPITYGPYEEIGPNATNNTGSSSLPDNLHAYVNSVLPDVTEGGDTDQYEDVIHEKLKNDKYENTKDVKEPKITTGHDSKA